jgi:transcription initiation factor TFIIH subunit 3
LVFINAHLAGNYLNKVGVIASHCDKAQWLYPTPTEQRPPIRSAQDRHKRQAGQSHRGETQAPAHAQSQSQDLSDSTKRLRLSNGPTTLNLKPPTAPTPAPSSSATEIAGNKYRPFRLVEEELIKNLSNLLSSTTPDVVSSSTSTMIAGALTLALSHINRESISYAESLIGSSTGVDMDGSGNNASSAAEATTSTALQSRILLVSASPSTDLAHQYIPIMNAIFACQRLAIPIDILQLPLPLLSPTPKPSSSTSSASSSSSSTSGSNSTVFLQQAADATKGIFIPVQLPKPSSSTATSSSSASQALLTYLLTSFLPSPATRAAHLILPTRIDVDFRAACFCHRNVVSTGFVCSICLSIFCSVPENGDCLTCGTHLTLGNYGARPAVVARRKKVRAR